MLEIFFAGGLLMYPLALCSILGFAIVLERAWVLRQSHVSPSNLVHELWNLVENNQLSAEKLSRISRRYPLGMILAVGLNNSKYGREEMSRRMEEEAAQQVHQLKRFLNMLGTIAVISPLLGLLGTVLGMIEVFFSFQESASPSFMARGISQALLTTAYGLAIAIPVVVCHRFFIRRLEDISVAMERQASRLVNLMFRPRGGQK